MAVIIVAREGTAENRERVVEGRGFYPHVFIYLEFGRTHYPNIGLSNLFGTFHIFSSSF